MAPPKHPDTLVRPSVDIPERLKARIDIAASTRRIPIRTLVLEIMEAYFQQLDLEKEQQKIN